MKDKMKAVLEELAKSLHKSECPEKVRDYIRLRRGMQERLFVEAKDTAHMHGAWVGDYHILNAEEVMDGIGWYVLYEELSKRESKPMSFIRALSYSLSNDKMVKRMGCEFDEEIIEQGTCFVSVAFDGAKLGLWDMDEAREACMKNHPSIPVFDEQGWKEWVMQNMGVEDFPELLEDDLDSIEVPKGGEDVYLF